MAEAVLDIKQWGNNLGVRLPAAVAREANLHVDQRVRICVEGDRVNDYAGGWFAAYARTTRGCL